MNYPSPDFDSAVDEVCHGTATEVVVSELGSLLRTDPRARDEYLWRVELHARLATVEATYAPAEPSIAPTTTERSRQGTCGLRSRVLFALASLAAAVLLSVASWIATRTPAGNPIAAYFGETADARWVAADVDHRPGEAVRAGQRVELAAGRVRLNFESTASVVLEGPAIFEAESANAGFLVLGRMTVTADAPEAKGFTVRTRTATAVDLGTVFTAEASPGGDSRFGVIAGEVEIHRPGVPAPDRLRAGDLLTVEAGRPRVTVRVERGDETPAFRFPSIEPPSDRDAADVRQGHATMTVVRGSLWISKDAVSGSPTVLLDGRGQSGRDVPHESVFFQNGEVGRLLLDLGRVAAVTKVNTYSWHQNWRNPDVRLRAVQKYTLYGSAADALPPTDGELGLAGWVPVARVDTDEYFGVVGRLDRPAQQACSITAAGGPLGRFRYLLWDCQPNRYADFKPLHHSFYGEFDVYAEP